MSVRTFRKETLSPVQLAYSKNTITPIQQGKVETVSYFLPDSLATMAADSGHKYDETSIVFFSATVYSTVYYNKKNNW